MRKYYGVKLFRMIRKIGYYLNFSSNEKSLKRQMRESLSRFVEGMITANELSEIHSECICEDAESPNGSHGSVKDCERLRHFLTSPSHMKVKKISDLKKKKDRYFRSKDLKRAYYVGLSVYRLEHAREDELNEGAKQLLENQRDNLEKIGSDKEFGGIIGYVDFRAISVRKPLEGTPFCVLETPLERIQSDTFKYPSHADITCSKKTDCLKEIDRNCEKVFNHMKETFEITIGSNSKCFQYSNYLPDIVTKNQNE